MGLVFPCPALLCSVLLFVVQVLLCFYLQFHHVLLCRVRSITALFTLTLSRLSHNHVHICALTYYPSPIVENHVAQKFVNKKINFPRLRIIQLYSNPSLMWYRFPLSLSLVATLPLLCTPPHTVTMYSATPSLQDLTRGTLQRQVPEPHQTMHYSRLIHSSIYINKKRLNCMYCTYAVHGDCKRTCIKIILKQTCLFL